MSVRDDFIEEVYLKWRLPLLKILKRKLGNEAEAEDLVQESFARWSASKADGKPVNPTAYVTRIAFNAVHESAYKRERERGIVVSLNEDNSDQYGCAPMEVTCPQGHAAHRQLLDRLEQALQELPERQCMAFTLHRFDGLSYEEIASTMRISRALVSRHISQAVAYCRIRVNYPSRQAMQTAVASKDAAHET